MAEDTAKKRNALHWIVGKLEEHQLPYQIVGGLAAIAHGGTRPLNDIDLYAPLGSAAVTFLADVNPYITARPQAVVEGPWDITYMKLTYHGQKIEIGDCTEPKIRDGVTGAWMTKKIDFATSVSKKVFDCEVKVMPVDQLIAYKKMLGREVDKHDVDELESLMRGSGL